jgi:hypothetical protein
MKKKILLSLVVLFIIGLVYLIFNWKPILIRFSGFRQPTIESIETVAGWIDTKASDYELVAVTNSKESFRQMQSDFGIPGIVIFDRNGFPVISSHGEGCQVVARNKLKTIKATDTLEPQFRAISIKHLDDVKQRLKLIHGDWEEVSEKLKGADFIAVYTWAKMFPDRSREMMQAVKEGLQNSNAKIYVISTNLDFMDSWMDGVAGDKVDLE